jgi:hypothetical protein
MTIHQCDLCGKDIGTVDDVVKVGYHSGSVAKTERSVRRGRANPLYAANPNIWLMRRFWARTSPLAIPSI